MLENEKDQEKNIKGAELYSDLDNQYKLRTEKTSEEELLSFMLPNHSCVTGVAKISSRTLTKETPYFLDIERKNQRGKIQYKLNKSLDKYFRGRTFQTLLMIVALLNKRGVKPYIMEGKVHQCVTLKYDEVFRLFNKKINLEEKSSPTVRKQISRAKKQFFEELGRINSITIERKFSKTEKGWGSIFEATWYESADEFALPLTNWFIDEILHNTKAREFPIELLSPDFENCVNLGYGIYNSLSAEFTTKENIITKNMLMDTALSYCPDLPSVKEVKDKHNYNYKREIIEPFTTKVQKLNGINGLSVEFINSSGKVVNIYDICDLSIEEFKNLKLKTTWSGKRFLSIKQYKKITEDNIIEDKET